MGIGKTVQALCAAEARLSFTRAPADFPAVLVVCPMPAKWVWKEQVARWAGATAAVIESLRPTGIPAARYVICNYDILAKAQRADGKGVMHEAHDFVPPAPIALVGEETKCARCAEPRGHAVHGGLVGWAETLVKHPFQIVILDEVHLLCGRKSRRTLATKSVVGDGVPVAWGLTGTPQPNEVRDLYSPIDILSGGLFGKYWAWAKPYAGAYEGKYGWVDDDRDALDQKRLDELAARIRFFALGRTKAEVGLQLPELRIDVIRVDVDAANARTADAEGDTDEERTVVSAQRATARAKRPIVVSETVEALRAGQKVIVFTYLRDECERIARDVGKAFGRPVQWVHGDTPGGQRVEQARLFREARRPACIVATIDSMLMALSLAGADLVHYGDLTWEAWKVEQSCGRAHRIEDGGRTVDRVLVKIFAARGSIDEPIADRVRDSILLSQKTTRKGNLQLATALRDEEGDRAFIARLFDKLRGEAPTL